MAIPKVKFVRLVFFLIIPMLGWIFLKQKGIHVVSTSINRVLRIRIDRDVLTYHQELLKELFTLAIKNDFSEE